MDSYIFKTILDISGIAVMLGILVFFGLSGFYNFMWLKKSNWESYSWIKIGYFIVSIIWIAIYSYTLLKIIFGNPIDTNFFGIIIVRPSVLLTGITFAFSSRSRYYSLLKGGKECQSLRRN